MKRRLWGLFPLLAGLLALSLVGGGVAGFYFGDQELQQSVEQDLSLAIEASARLGRIQFLETNGVEDYQVFFDTSSVYLLREDDPTTEASFQVKCTLPGDVEIPAGYDLALACDVTLADGDEREVKKAIVTSNRAVEESILYSDSLVDYLVPLSVASTSRMQNRFALLGEDETARSLTYRCLLVEGLQMELEEGTGEEGEPVLVYTSDNFRLKFGYRSYDLLDGGHSHHGSLAPGSQYQSMEGYRTIMEKIQAAEANGSVSVVFQLVLLKGAEG